MSSFALTEVDTEYKPGSDALRMDWTIRTRTNLSLFAVAGKWKDEVALAGSSFAARATHTFGKGELGGLVGFIRRDVVLALDGVIDAGKLDLYGEAAVYLLTAGSLTPPVGPDRPRAAVRAVLGATYKPIDKLTLTPELFYNSFGFWRAQGYVDVALSDRVATGEMYNLGQLYVAAVAQWKVHPLLDSDRRRHREPGRSVRALHHRAELQPGRQHGPGCRRLPAGGPPPETDVAPPIPRSEFGLYPYFMYLELKAAI